MRKVAEERSFGRKNKNTLWRETSRVRQAECGLLDALVANDQAFDGLHNCRGENSKDSISPVVFCPLEKQTHEL